MKIKHYKLKQDLKREELINFGAREGGSWVAKDAELFISESVCFNNFEFDIDIAFPNNLKKWNDFDYVLVLDSDFCQPYTPFYGDNYGKNITNFKSLENVIKQYNEYLDKLPFLEEVL